LSSEDGIRPAEVDPRPRRLLERYATLVGGMTMELGPDLLQVELPASEQRRLGTGERLLVALSPLALDEEPEAEIFVVGSGLLDRVIEAIRGRGSHDDRGLVPSTVSPSPESAVLSVPVEGVAAGLPVVDVAALPVGRLLARVSIHSGSAVTERLVESSIVDLTIGTPVPEAVARACDEALDDASADPASPGAYRRLKPRPSAELLKLLFADLERRLQGDLTAIAQESGRASAAERGRLDAYYQRMLDEVDPDEDPEDVRERKAAIGADRARRLEEEDLRAAVRVTVHPVQLIEWQVLAQRAEWELRAPSGAAGKIVATRTLVGGAVWQVACPSCGKSPELLRVCHEGHVACEACSERCGVCGEGSCRTHGLGTCELEGHAACARHIATCKSCGRAHCDSHSGTCRAHDHRVCAACIVACARCGLQVCQAHGIRTGEEAPLGARWLCANCTVCCEGGSNEPVGLDEVERCTSCERYICRHHAATCLVDGRLHCSRHLRRSDRSGRLACDEHRGTCADEPNSVLATDELAACSTCGRQVCENHAGTCSADGLTHCIGHLLPLRDQSGQLGCGTHRTTCAIDGVAFSLTGTRVCPVCSASICDAHLAACRNCARHACVRDLEHGLCLTCRRLEELADPEDSLIAAALEANKGEPPTAKRWRSARDGRDTVVELDLGWRRRLVFSVRHGESRPATALYHSLLGSERRR
jgi:hypothetical protein